MRVLKPGGHVTTEPVNRRLVAAEAPSMYLEVHHIVASIDF